MVAGLLLAPALARADLVYGENFDALSPGVTQSFPGDAGQGGWFSALAVSPAFGEIQGAIAQGGQALHEFTSASNAPAVQTIDRHDFAAFDVSGSPLITLSFDFYAHSSNLDAVNLFSAVLEATGGPHPGFQIIGVGLGAGNNTPKIVTGLNVGLAAFNGIDNNGPIPLAVGQGLAFDAWHHLSVSLNQAQDRWISITVDGQTQDLSAYLPPRSFLDGGVSQRGQLIETLAASLIPDDLGGVRSDDDIYWDNVSLFAQSVPEPATPALLALGALALALRSRYSAQRASAE
jgi:hypothetical protein